MRVSSVRRIQSNDMKLNKLGLFLARAIDKCYNVKGSLIRESCPAFSQKRI